MEEREVKKGIFSIRAEALSDIFGQKKLRNGEESFISE
jgi:hypothetical protein